MHIPILFLVLVARTQAPAPPASTTVLVIETEMGRRWSDGRQELDVSWQAGALANRGRYALGATAFAAFGLNVNSDRPVQNTRLGVLPRYRRWLGRGAALDLSAGPSLELRSGASAALLTTAAVAVGWPNDVALSGRVDVGEQTGATWFLGARLGLHQITEALEGEGIGLAVWGIVRLLEAAAGGP
jgi:hypothetical protein